MRRTNIYPFMLIIALLSGFGYIAKADEQVHPQLGATYVKLTDGTKSFSLSLSASIDDKRVNIVDAPLTVYAVNETERKLLGTVSTSRKGKAALNVNPALALPKGKGGDYTFEIRFDGKDKIGSASKTIQVQDAFLEMSFSEKDSVNKVIVRVVSVNDKGENAAIRGVPVEFYIKRLFCLYRFGGMKSDSTGLCTVEFPKNMPGDTIGNVIVVAKILENDTYGTIETIRNFPHGQKLNIEQKAKRGLGDTDAPLWMVYTLLVLLSGVWLHVIYVVSLVVRINIIGKKSLQGRVNMAE